MPQVAGHDAATVRVEPTGEVRGFVSAASQGQGHATTLAQVLADELGVDIGAVSIVEGDTERCPYGSGSFASRSMVVSGGALVLAARRVREKVARIAGHMLEAAPEDLSIEGGAIAVRGAPGRTLTVADVARLAHRPSAGTLPPGVDPGLEATQYYDPPPATFSNGAHVAVVEVDAETGLVEIVRYVVVEDCGKMVNPMIVEGQTHGAVAQGIGNALYEDMVYDESGQPMTTSFMDYLVPGSDGGAADGRDPRRDAARGDGERLQGHGGGRHDRLDRGGGQRRGRRAPPARHRGARGSAHPRPCAPADQGKARMTAIDRPRQDSLGGHA